MERPVARSRFLFALHPLCSGFVPAKPRRTVSDEIVLALERAGRLINTRKRDGYRVLAVHLSSGVHLYTRGIQDITERFPAVVEELRGLRLPHGTLTDGELLYQKGGRDDLGSVTRLVTMSSSDAVMYQGLHGSANYMMFDVVVFGGRVVSTLSHAERIGMVRGFFTGKVCVRVFDRVFPIEVLSCSLKEAEAKVRANRWEGLVLYDGRKASAFRLDGKSALPPRPEGCWKRKPILEDDFFVRTWVRGSGKNKDRMGKLPLLQIDPNTGADISCGEVGSGFEDAEREVFARAKYPLVVEVRFDERYPSGALRNARFLRRREDKKWNECVCPKEYAPKKKK